jgi:hypothetical protein
MVSVPWRRPNPRKLSSKKKSNHLFPLKVKLKFPQMCQRKSKSRREGTKLLRLCLKRPTNKLSKNRRKKAAQKPCNLNKQRPFDNRRWPK